MRHIVHGVVNHTKAWFVGAWILTALAGMSIYFNFDISSDFKDLMPENARSMTDFVKISDRFGSVTPLKVMIESPAFPGGRAPEPIQIDPNNPSRGRPIRDILDDAQHQTILIAAASASASALAKIDSVGYVHYHNDKQFFKDNILLYASVDALEDLYKDVDKALDDARKEKGNRIVCEQTGLCDDDEAVTPDPNAPPKPKNELLESGFDPDEQLSKNSSEINFYNDYFLDELADGSWLITIHVRFRDASTTMKASEKHLKEVNDTIASLDLTKKIHPKLLVNNGGGLQDQSDEYNTLMTEIKYGGISTVVMLLLMMAVFFRRLRATITIMLPLVMSIVWCLGLAFWLVGTLNLITAFLFAILLGLGIDFGIHVLARYDEDRARGANPHDAMEASLLEVGSSNVVGGLTTSAAFFTLMFGDFRGFSQFGLVAGLGVLISLTAMLTVLPAVELLMQRALPVKPRAINLEYAKHTRDIPWLRKLGVVAVITCVSFSIISATQAKEIQFEENFYRLKMRPPAQSKQQVNRYGVADKRHSSPAIAMLDSLEEISALEKIMQRRRDPQTVEQIRIMRNYFPHGLDLFTRLMPYAFLTVDQYTSAPIIGAIGRMLPHNLWSNIPYYLRYDRTATLTEHRLRELITLYPRFSHLLAYDLLHTSLSYNDLYSRLSVLISMHNMLPSNLHKHIPTRANSRALHSVDYFASIYSFMPGTPSEQVQKLALIERIRARTAPKRVRFLPPEDRKNVEKFYPYLDAKTVTVSDLPEWVKIQFKEAGDHPAPKRADQKEDYTYGNVGVIYQNTSSIKGAPARRFSNEMRSIIIDGKGVTVSNNAFIFSDMLIQVKKDGVLVAILGLITVMLFVFFQHRSLLQTIIVSAPLFTSLSWMIGLMVIFNMRLGFFNMVTVPLIMGMGIDDGIHFYHRYREEGRGSILHVIRQTRGAIFMTSATTIVGFGSMAFSSHMGLNTLGELVIIGMSSCWLATMTIQPGLLLLAERFNIRAVLPDHEYVAKANSPTETPASPPQTATT